MYSCKILMLFRTSMAALSGSTAGILGLPTLYGFGFYAVSVFGKPYDIYFLLFFKFLFYSFVHFKDGKKPVNFEGKFMK